MTQSSYPQDGHPTILLEKKFMFNLIVGSYQAHRIQVNVIIEKVWAVAKQVYCIAYYTCISGITFGGWERHSGSQDVLFVSTYT